MPILNGWNASKILRKNFPNLRITGCTAYAFNEAYEQCFKSGMDEVMSKPLDKEKIRSLF